MPKNAMNSCTNQLPYFREERFRTPLSEEKTIGLWVDRIGSGVGQLHKERLRILGQYAAIYIESGHGEYVDKDGSVHGLSPGDVVLCFPGEPCTYYATNHWKTHWVVWNGPLAEKLEKIGYLSSVKAIVKDDAKIVYASNMALHNLMGQEDLSSIIERQIILLKMISNLGRSNIKRNDERQVVERLKGAVSYISSNYIEKFDIDKLAKDFNFSTTHFRRMIKRSYGKTPNALLEDTRISKAKELISKGYPIKVVSQLAGYNDVYYFMRVFKKVTSLTPCEFRRMQV
jgi:AraC-like DNA-binding protein